MCHAAQETGAPYRGYIDRKKENVIFTPLYLGDPLSDWNQICYRVARQLGESIHSKFEGNRSSHFRDTSCQSFDSFFFVFSRTCKNCYKMQTRTPITMKFGTQKGSPKANPSIKFGANPMNGSGFMTDCLQKQDRFVVTPTE